MAGVGARVRGARRERVGSSAGFGRGDGHEPARELVGCVWSAARGDGDNAGVGIGRAHV